MNITPVIPDGYNGPIKQLTCRICKHIFYIAQDDYHRYPEVRFCHECSLILREELEKTQEASTLTTPTVVEKPVVRSPLPSSVAPIQPIHLPQPRTIGREKMTVEQLFEEAAMLCKTWRYKEALHSYEDILQRDPHCLKALSGRANMLSTLDRSNEALAVYEEIVRLEPDSVQAYSDKGDILMELRRHDEALAAFDTALQLDPSSRQASAGKWFLFTHLHRDEEAERFFPPKTEDSVYQQELTQPCHTAEDYSRRGDILRTLGRHEEAIRAYEESLRLDPLHFGVYTDIYIMRFKKGSSQKVVTILNQAVQAARLHIYHAEALSQEEANADYCNAEVSPQAGRSGPLLAACCLIAKVDLKEVAEAKARLQTAGKEISDEAIKAEIHLMYEEQKIVSLKSSPLFLPVCLLMQEMQEWSGTAKQFKELLSPRFPDELKTWRSPARFVEELKKITPALQEEGIAVSIPPDTKLVTLAKKKEEELP